MNWDFPVMLKTNINGSVDYRSGIFWCRSCVDISVPETCGLVKMYRTASVLLYSRRLICPILFRRVDISGPVRVPGSRRDGLHWGVARAGDICPTFRQTTLYFPTVSPHWHSFSHSTSIFSSSLSVIINFNSHFITSWELLAFTFQFQKWVITVTIYYFSFINFCNVTRVLLQVYF
jgi:hypothetical protein